MARVYIITEDEMRSLLVSLELKTLRAGNYSWNDYHSEKDFPTLTKNQRDMVNDHYHRTFHMIVCNWADKMGFKEFWKT